ncbi:BatD family protein [soil metagenome]
MRNSGSIRDLLAAGLFLLQGLVLSAQTISISLDKDTIGFHETVVLRLTAEAKDFSAFAELPQPDGLIVVERMNSYALVGSGGKIRFTQTFTLSPYKAGTFTIGPAWVQSGSNRLFSNKVTLVVKASEQGSLSTDFFMRCEADKKEAVIGEQITLSIKLYARHGLDVTFGDERPLAKTFNGFWYKEGVPVLYGDTLIAINGLVYRVITVYKEYVFPNTVGKLKIPSYNYLCFVKQNPFPTGDPMVDDVMGIPVGIQLISPEIPITVSPLPEKNKPQEFGGDVGKYSLSASIDKENIKVNEAVKITVRINGTGNIDFIQLPEMKFPEGIESYSPVSTDSITIGYDGIEGEKVFIITLIPKKEGMYTLPGVSFSCYNAKKKEYETMQTPEFKLDVAPGDPSSDVSQNNLPETFPDGLSYGNILSRIALIAVPAILLIVLLFYRSVKTKKQIAIEAVQNNLQKNDDIPFEYTRHKPDIHSMLLVAERLIINGNIQSGIGQLYETLMSAVLFKTELNREEASIHQLRYRLGLKNISPELISETIHTLEELAAQRYTPHTPDRTTIYVSLQKTSTLSLELIS